MITMRLRISKVCVGAGRVQMIFLVAPRIGPGNRAKTRMVNNTGRSDCSTSNSSFTSAVTSAILIPTFHITFFGRGSASAWTLEHYDSISECVWSLFWTAGASSST